MCINFSAIVLSILGVLTPVTGALWHNAASILVVLNAARLYDRKRRAALRPKKVLTIRFAKGIVRA
jgi:cation transport ATPase